MQFGLGRQCTLLLFCLQSKQSASTLAEQVVDPSNTTRIRLLSGRIPEKEELVAKLQVHNTPCMMHWLRDAKLFG
jgi:hypothetical protein